MERKTSQIQPPTYGDFITILSIDGGGIRGIIPATILTFLESQLQVNYIYIYIYDDRDLSVNNINISFEKVPRPSMVYT